MVDARQPGLVTPALSSRATSSRRSAHRWYTGSFVGLIWLGIPIAQLWTIGLPLWAELLGQVLLVLWAAVYVFAPPLFWGRRTQSKVLGAVAFWASSFIFVPLLAESTTSLWVFVGVALAVAGTSMVVVTVFAAALSVVTFGVIAVVQSVDDAVYLPLIMFSVIMLMAAFGRQIDLVRRLRESQAETARLAVLQERGRVARDIHDILGHSLTVITVKAELAGRLVAEHPDRLGDTAREIADIERLARGALADVRATVTGYRGVNLAAELSGAREALNSAGIQADLPNNIDTVPGEVGQLFAWVVREGVTNVIRHSGAGRCSIALAPDSIVVADDGRAVPADALRDAAAGVTSGGERGNGLAGLAERVGAAGGALTAGPVESGGYVLRVSL